MASDDISQLADALSKTHVGEGELSYKGLGLKLDNAESGQVLNVLGFVSVATVHREISKAWTVLPLQIR